ncbi:MAG: hypothetical protein WBO36_02735 [Saprospiraceae bacterium]
MKSFKDKIENFKKEPDQNLWASFEQQVIELNQTQPQMKRLHLSDFVPKAIIIVFLFILIFGVIFFLNPNQNRTAVTEMLIGGDHGLIDKHMIDSSDKNQIVSLNPSNTLCENQPSEKTNQNKNDRNFTVTDHQFKSSNLVNSNIDYFKMKSKSKLTKENVKRAFKSKVSESNVEKTIGEPTHDYNLKYNSDNVSEISSKASKSETHDDERLKNQKSAVTLSEEIKSLQSKDEQSLALEDLLNKSKNINVALDSANVNYNIAFLYVQKTNPVHSMLTGLKNFSPCNPKPGKHLWELGGSMGFSENHYYSGYFTNFLVEYRVNKLLRTGIRFNYQRYTDRAKYITSPDVLSKHVYSNIVGYIGLILVDHKRVSMALDLYSGLYLVSEHERVQAQDHFMLAKSQYHGLNYLVGAHVDYQISRRWKLGLEYVIDIKNETELTGVRLKYNL